MTKEATVIPSEVEGSRCKTVGLRRGIPRLRFAPLGMTNVSEMKSFTDLFIKRPVLAIVVSFVILIAGLQAMKTFNVRQYPRSDIAAITVTTVYVGADAELVRGFITTPLERAIAAADGIDYIQSQSTQSAVDDHRAIEAELRREQSALRHQLESGRDPEQSAAGITDPGHRHSGRRFAVCFRVT